MLYIFIYKQTNFIKEEKKWRTNLLAYLIVGLVAFSGLFYIGGSVRPNLFLASQGWGGQKWVKLAHFATLKGSVSFEEIF